MRKLVRLIVLLALFTAGSWSATQWAAAKLGDDPDLSGRLYQGQGWALYTPWSLVSWSYSDAGNLPAVQKALAAFWIYGLGITAAMALRARQAAPRVKPFGAECWGTPRDARRAGLLRSRGTVVGAFNGRVLTYDGPEHQLVSGASRSGKGVGHVIPTLLCWPDSALVYDVKGELWETTAGFRSQWQHCLLFNPTRPDSSHFNPLLEVRKGPHEVRDVQNIVQMLVNPDGSKKTLDVWDQNASQFLTALILHVLYAEPPQQKHLERVRELLLDFNRTCLTMMQTPHRLNPHSHVPEVYPEISRVAQSMLHQADRFRSSVRGTAEAYLTLWADELVCEMTSRSDFALGDLVCADRPVTLYVQPPPSDADRLRPLIRLILNQIGRALMEQRTSDSRSRPKKHRLLLLLDEFPTLGKLEFFSMNLRQMAGYGLKAHLIVQSFNDIAEAYGPHNTIIDNCHVLVCFASADTVTQQRISQMTGEAVEYRDSYSGPRSSLGAGHRNVSSAEHVRPLLTPGQVRTLPYDQQLVFVTGFRPFRTEKLRYYDERAFTRRVLAPPKQPSTALRRPAGHAHDWEMERPKGPPMALPLEPSEEDPMSETEGTPAAFPGNQSGRDALETEAGGYF